jgi:hypothetical protein
MSLAGNLGDLGFGDILQIVSLSRKSGVFLVHQGTQKAKIIFQDGEVLAAFTNFERQDLCRRLFDQGAAGADVVQAAQRRFRAQGGRESIADCLIEAGVPGETIDAVIRSEIERVVLRIFEWEDGDFSFELKDVVDDLARVRANPYRLVLREGISPQFLAMEKTRLLDEARRPDSLPQERKDREEPPAAARESEAGAEGVAGTVLATLPEAGVPASAEEAWPVGMAAREPGRPAVRPARGVVPEGLRPRQRPVSSDTRRFKPAAVEAPVILVDDEARFLHLVGEALEAGLSAISSCRAPTGKGCSGGSSCSSSSGNATASSLSFSSRIIGRRKPRLGPASSTWTSLSRSRMSPNSRAGRRVAP